MKQQTQRSFAYKLDLNEHETNQIFHQLSDSKQELQNFLKNIQNALTNLPEGSLRISHDRLGIARYYHRTVGGAPGGSYINQSHIDLANALAQKRYLQLVANHMEALILSIQSSCESWEVHTPYKLFETLPKEIQVLAEPISLSDEDYTKQWLQKTHDSLTNWDPDSNLITRNGESVRSKSELIIADTLAAMGIPYKYECPLQLSSKTIYPDFTLLDVHHRQELYLEHFGMMGDETYAAKSIQKINDYAANKIYLGDRLLVSMESATSKLNVRLLERQLQFYMNR